MRYERDTVMNRDTKLTDLFVEQLKRIYAPNNSHFSKSALGLSDFQRASCEIAPEQAFQTADIISMGIDYGEKLSHIVIIGTQPDLGYETCYVIHTREIESIPLSRIHEKRDSHVDQISRFAEEFEVDVIVNDANGIGTDRHTQLRDICRDIEVFGAYFDTGESARKTGNVIEPIINGDRITCSKVDRVAELIQAIRSGRILLPESLAGRDKFLHHLTSMSVHAAYNAKTRIHGSEIEYHHKDTHFFCALLYALLGIWRRKNET